MNPKLKIETKHKQFQEDEDVIEPVSPTGQYFNSKSLSICILGVLECQVPFDDSCAIPLLHDPFLKINPRFSSIMVSDKEGGRQWKKVEVNLHDHLNIPSFPEGLSIEAYDNMFDEYITNLSINPLPQDRPLWEVHVIKYPTSKAASHIIFKLHHALADGYSLMGALLSCLQRADDPKIPLTFPSTRSVEVKSKNIPGGFMSWVPRTLSSMVNGVYDFGWGLLKSTFNADDNSPIKSGNENLGSTPIEISTIELSLHQIKVIKSKLGTTVNDIVVGIIFLGIRLYMQKTNKEFGGSPATALVLLNTRNVSSYMSVEEMINSRTKIWGNQFAFLHLTLPKLIDGECSNPVDFVFGAQKQVMRYKTSPSVHLTGQCLEILRKFKGPEVVSELVYATLNKTSLAITNMIGPVEQASCGGHNIKGIYFMPLGSPQSLVATIMSYMQTLRIGLGTEKSFIDSKRLNSCIQNAFELIYEAATKSK